MAVEVDFLAVGDGSRSGDALALRYGNALSRNFEVMVVDGGTKASGAQLVDFIRNMYGTDRVAHVVNSHPDGDHSSGLSVVVEALTVERLWMHRPWEYAEDIRQLFRDGRITDESLDQSIREALQTAHDLEQCAIAKRIPISEPYQGVVVGPFMVLSPDRDWYLNELVPHFRGTPAPVRQAESFVTSLIRELAQKGREAVEWVGETMAIETLGEGGETSAENESSVVMCASFDGEKLLLTGDAGLGALGRAHAFASSRGIRLDDLWTVQIPHHGSRRNVAPSILNLIKARYAIVSAAREDKDHPRRAVTNAFKRRGAKVYATKGQPLQHHIGMSLRNGYSTATEIPFYDRVEAP